MTSISKRRYIIKYTVLFLLLSAAFYSAFLLNGKSFVWSADGYTQHLRALTYYAKWLRTIAYNILVLHQWEIPAYSFSIGYGSDILTSLQYYCIGEPITLFCALVPVNYMPIFYTACVYLRLYFAGLFFSFLGMELRQIRHESALLAASFIYIFSSYSMSNLSHPFFLIGLVFAPMVLIGVEKIWKQQSPCFYIVAVFIASISNFFYFYITVIFIVLYVCIRLIVDPVMLKERIHHTITCAIGGIIGTGMGAVILLPTLYAASMDARTSLSQTMSLLFSASHYQSIPKGLLESFGGITVIALLFMIRSTTVQRRWKVLFAALFFCNLFPWASRIFNITGESRFDYLILLVMSIALLDLAETAQEQQGRSKHILVGFGMYCVLCAILGWQFSERSLLQSLIGILLVCYLAFRQQMKTFVFLLTAVVTVLVTAYESSSFATGNNTGDYLAYDGLMERMLWNRTAQISAEHSPTGFYRITSEGEERNAGMLSGVSSISYFWSLSNPYVVEMLSELEVETASEMLHEICSYDHRTTLEAMAGVKYDMDGSERDLSLPLAYLQTTRISESEFQTLTALQKQQAMLDGVIVHDTDTDLPELQPTDFVNNCEAYALQIASTTGNVQIDDHTITVLEPDASVQMAPLALSSGEWYLHLTELSYEEYTDWDIYRTLGLTQSISRYEKRKMQYEDRTHEEATKVTLGISCATSADTYTKDIQHLTPSWHYYFGKEDYLTKLADGTEGTVTITLTFPQTGVYTFDDLSLQVLSTDYQRAQIQKLSDDVLSDIDLHNENAAYATNRITALSQTSQDGMLVWSIPYSEGWKAYVDGEQADLYRANIMYLGLPVSAGEHQIRLVYETPFMDIAIPITIFSWILFFCFAWFDHKSRSKITLNQDH
ncbi:MAG: YfhO family protein [Lachnospiraceae bacterium]|nr:YfhO family protein [Lachnospiraceae bacterium]